jgi:poly(A) polymerase
MLPIDTNIFPQKKGVYIVGGSIRDLLYGRAPNDYDVAVADDPARFARSLASRTAGHVVEFGKYGHTILRVVTKGFFFDIMPINGISIEEDLLRRDFTINAMAMEVSSGSLIDLSEGQKDLAAKIVRMVDRDVFQKDPVRLIRAYRLAAAFDFRVDGDTEAAICRDAELICKSAGERIREELFKILNFAESQVQLYRMAHSGLLFAIFPELLQLKNYRLRGGQPAVYLEQTLDAYVHLENLLESRDLLMPQPAMRHYEDIDTRSIVLLKLAVLFQDIGRPVMPTVNVAGSLPIDGRAAESAGLARKICRRLRFSKRQSDTIDFIIRHHIQPYFIFKAGRKKILADRAFIRFFMKCGDYTPAILLHALANFMGRRTPQDPAILSFSKFVSEAIHTYYSVLRPRAALPRPLNGNDLVKDFGLEPSALFRQILAYIEEEHLARKNLTREQAFELVRKLLIRKTRNPKK